MLTFSITGTAFAADEHPLQAGAAAVVDPEELGPIYLGGYGQEAGLLRGKQ